MRNSLHISTFVFITFTLLMRFSGLMSKMVLARVISPYEYGILALAVITLPNMFQYVTNFFLHDLLSHSKEGNRYFGFGMVYSFFVSILVCLLVFIFHDSVFRFVNLPEDNWEIFFIGFLIVLISNALLANMTGILRGLRRYSLTSILVSMPALVKLAFIVFAVYIFNISDFNIILLIFSISPLFVLISLMLLEYNRILPLMKTVNLPSKQIILFGLSIYVVSLFGGINQSIIKVIVSNQLGLEYLGYFDVSFTLATVLSFAFGAMQFISVPEATNSKDKKDLLFSKNGLGDVTRALFAFLIFCSMLLFIYPYDFVGILFSEEYLPAADYVSILTVGYIFLFIQQFSAYVDISIGSHSRKNRNLILSTVGLLILSPIVAYILIDLDGFRGAYLASSLLLVVYSLLTIVSLGDLLAIKTLAYRGERLILSFFATFGFLYYFELNVIIGSVVGLLFYFILILSTGYLRRQWLFKFLLKRFD